MIKKVLWAAAFLLLLLVVVLVARGGFSRSPQVEEEPRQALVEVVSPALEELAETVALTGSIVGDSQVDVAAGLGGRVVYRFGQEGARVSRGQVLLRLRDTELQAQKASALAALEAARARLSMLRSGARPQERQQAENMVSQAEAAWDNTRRNYERMAALFDQGAVPQQQLELARTQYVSAEAQMASARAMLSLLDEGARREDLQAAAAGVSQAEAGLRLVEAQLEQTVVKASVSGIISNIYIEPGEMAMPGKRLMTISQQDRLYLETRVPEREFVLLSVGQAAEILIDSLPGLSFAGRVAKLAPVADQRNRSFKARLSLSGNGPSPGMFGRARVRVSEPRPVLTLPVDVLREADGGAFVMLVEEGRARKQAVVVGMTLDGRVEISGLSPDAKVISVGQDGVEDGERLRIIQKEN